MLRITVHDNPRVLTFQLEGKLAGPWLRELEACWHSTVVGDGKPVLRVDLTDVHLRSTQRLTFYVRAFPAQPATYGYREAIGAIS